MRCGQAVAVREPRILPREHKLGDRVRLGRDVAQALVPLLAQGEVCVLQYFAVSPVTPFFDGMQPLGKSLLLTRDSHDQRRVQHVPHLDEEARPLDCAEKVPQAVPRLRNAQDQVALPCPSARFCDFIV